MSYKQDLQTINTGLQGILSAVNDLPDGIQRSPLPMEVFTENEMTAILSNATDKDIGAVYKYMGEPGTYEKGSYYIIETEEVV